MNGERTMSKTLTSDARRARSLALALAFVLGGTFLYAKGVQACDAATQDAAATPTTYPMDSHGFTTLAVTAPASGRENVPAASSGVAPTATAWTSPGVFAGRGFH